MSKVLLKLNNRVLMNNYVVPFYERSAGMCRKCYNYP